MLNSSMSLLSTLVTNKFHVWWMMSPGVVLQPADVWILSPVVSTIMVLVLDVIHVDNYPTPVSTDQSHNQCINGDRHNNQPGHRHSALNSYKLLSRTATALSAREGDPANWSQSREQRIIVSRHFDTFGISKLCICSFQTNLIFEVFSLEPIAKTIDLWHSGVEWFFSFHIKLNVGKSLGWWSLSFLDQVPFIDFSDFTDFSVMFLSDFLVYIIRYNQELSRINCVNYLSWTR